MTVPYLGKRYGGNLVGSGAGVQSGNYGDTLWIPLQTFNDSGGSININTGATTLTKADIEIFKNGEVTPRATDSGYFIGDTGTSYINASGQTQTVGADTGQYGDRAGLRRIGIRIMNTADDASFYEVGATYHVAIDNFTITGQSGHTQTVRTFIAWFEIGDSGAGLGTGSPVETDYRGIVDAIWDETDTGHSDTGSFGRLRQGVNVKKVVGDTGAAANVLQHFLDTGGTRPVDTGYFATSEKDTGAISDAVWTATTRALTAFNHDTGVADTVWKSSTSNYTADTGSVAYAQGRLMAIRNDTGAVHTLGGMLVTVDTGQSVLDTGIIVNAVWNSLKSSHGDTGSFGEELGQGVNITRIWGDSGAPSRIDRAGRTEVLGTCAALGTTTSVIASALSPTSAVNDQFVGRIIIFDKDTTTAALRGQATDITAYTHATLTFTVTALTTAPASGDTFVVV